VRNIGLLFLLLPVALLVSPGKTGSSQKGPSAFAALLEVGPAVVGQPSRIDWRLTEGKSAGTVPARLTLLITHLEKGKRVFFLNAIPTDGRFSLRFHFTDGSAYRITSIGWVQGSGPIQEEREINVTAVEPPRQAIYPSLFLFLAVIALGLAAGRFSRSIFFPRPRD
jgi:hypothetical protein